MRMILFPCPKCENLVEFDCNFKTTADYSHQWADVDVKTASYCENCDEYLRWTTTSGSVRLRIKEFFNNPNKTEPTRS